jgi:hypothetical protein
LYRKATVPIGDSFEVTRQIGQEEKNFSERDGTDPDFYFSKPEMPLPRTEMRSPYTPRLTSKIIASESSKFEPQEELSWGWENGRVKKIRLPNQDAQKADQDFIMQKSTIDIYNLKKTSLENAGLQASKKPIISADIISLSMPGLKFGAQIKSDEEDSPDRFTGYGRLNEKDVSKLDYSMLYSALDQSVLGKNLDTIESPNRHFLSKVIVSEDSPENYKKGPMRVLTTESEYGYTCKAKVSSREIVIAANPDCVNPKGSGNRHRKKFSEELDKQVRRADSPVSPILSKILLEEVEKSPISPARLASLAHLARESNEKGDGIEIPKNLNLEIQKMGQSLTDSKFFINDSATGLDKSQNCLMSGFSAETNGESFDLKSSSNQKCLEIDEMTSPVEFSNGPPKKKSQSAISEFNTFYRKGKSPKEKKEKKSKKKTKKERKKSLEHSEDGTEDVTSKCR